jgi:hypothetical protein
VDTKSGITLAEIQAELRVRGIEVEALSTMHLMLWRLGLTHKKDAQGGRTGPVGRSPRAVDAFGCGSASWTQAALCSWAGRAPPPT